MQQSLKLLLAVVIVLVILAAAYYLWWTKDTVKFAITGLQIGTSGTITLTGTTSATSTTNWVNRPIHIYTSSLGKIVTTVTSATTTSIVAAAPTTAPTGTYTLNTADYARIYLK